MGLIWNNHLNWPDLPEKYRQIELLQITDKMLMTVPIGTTDEATTLWSGLRPLQSKVFLDFFAKAAPQLPKLELENCHYKEGTTAKGWKWFGMKNNESGAWHGI